MRAIAVTLTMLTIAGCASKLPPSPNILNSDINAATVTAEGAGFKNWLKPSFGIVGAKISTHITKLDNGSVQHAPKNKERIYWIKPGNHTIEARCSITMGERVVSGKGNININLQAGEKYRLTAKLVTTLGKDTSRCEPIIEGP